MSKALTTTENKKLDSLKGGFDENEVHEGFETSSGFFSSFQFLIKCKNEKFEVINNVTGESITKLEEINFIPIYTFTSTKLLVGSANGLVMSTFKKWSIEEKESAAVTYGSLKPGSDIYSMGSFVGVYRKYIDNKNLRNTLKTRFYIVLLMQGNQFGVKPIIMTMGPTAIKTWSNYSRVLQSEGIPPIATICQATLKEEVNKDGENYHRPDFKFMDKSGETSEIVKETYFPVRNEVKVNHMNLIAMTEEIETEESTNETDDD